MKFKRDTALFFIRCICLVPFLDRIFYRLCVLYIDESRGFSYDAAVNGENKIIEVLGRALKEKVTFFDVGANVGEWSIHAVRCFRKYDGHLFELSEETYEILNKRLGGDDSLRLNNVALSDCSGKIEYLNYGCGDGGNTMLVHASYHKKDSVVSQSEAMTGDMYCDMNNIQKIDFLKIDTEGVEYSVLKGFDKMFSDHCIDVIQFEYGYTHGDAKILMKDFFTFFEAHGYIVGRLTKHGVQFKSFSYTDNDFKSGPNYIACLPSFRGVLENF